jgi:hypothetical protein
MVALHGREIVDVPLSEVTRGLKLVDPGSELVRCARDLGVCFGDMVPSKLALEG